MDLQRELDTGFPASRARRTTLLLIADTSPGATRAARACIELARAIDADVVVVHVHERNAWLDGTGDFKTLDEAEQFVTRVAEQIHRADVRARAEILTVRTGHKAAALRATACRDGIDLLVVAVPKTSRWRRRPGCGFLDGLVRESSRPVVAIA